MVVRPPALVALVLGLLAAGLLVIPPPALADPADPTPRTWVVDAVDDASGNRWEAEATGGAVVTIRPGDTVEWRFDRAATEHDLTSEDTRTAWAEPLREYRVPGGAAVRRTFIAPGQYEYLCSLHGTVMRGTVIVEEAGANRSPTGTAQATPTSGPAPLIVDFVADVTDPDRDDLTHAWDFGTGETSAAPHAMHRYDTPGHYTATLEVSDGNGGTFRQTFAIHVGAAEEPLPALEAHAHHGAGPAPLPVAFSADVTTDGTFTAFADGSTRYPDLAGSATMIRSRGQTYAAIEVTGLKPNASHMVHVHEQACASANGGAHFRFDESLPFAEENELWLPFTSDAAGRSASVVATHPGRAGAKAVSIVVHDPDNPALRIGCVDLAPVTAGLSYRWEFGDGTTGVGPDPDHVYAAAGSYTATVTVSRDGIQRQASVGVVVPASTAPADTSGPRIRGTRPAGTVRDRTPTIRARVDDDATTIRRRHLRLRVDGRAITGFRYRARTGRVSWTPPRALPPGRHRVRLVAVDDAGNRTARVWRFRVR